MTSTRLSLPERCTSRVTVSPGWWLRIATIRLIVAIRSHQPGETVTLEVQRSGKDKRVEVTLDGKVG